MVSPLTDQNAELLLLVGVIVVSSIILVAFIARYRGRRKQYENPTNEMLNQESGVELPEYGDEIFGAIYRQMALFMIPFVVGLAAFFAIAIMYQLHYIDALMGIGAGVGTILPLAFGTILTYLHLVTKTIGHKFLGVVFYPLNPKDTPIQRTLQVKNIIDIDMPKLLQAIRQTRLSRLQVTQR